VFEAKTVTNFVDGDLEEIGASVGSVSPELVVVEMGVASVSRVESVSENAARSIEGVVVTMSPFGELHFDVATARRAHFLETQRRVLGPDLKRSREDVFLRGSGQIL